MDAVELHTRTVRNFAQLVSTVGPDQWSAPTPCSGWDVRELVNHVVGEERWAVPLMAGQTIGEVGNSLDGDLLGDDPGGAAADAARAAEVAGELRPGTVHLSYGDEDPDEYLRQLSADHLIHGWDLATAIGANTRMDPELVADVSAWFVEREDVYRSAGMIGERRGGFTDPAEQLLDAFGRDPGWKA
jgi:uncharacterized protein (TIGR03086 family)